MSRLEEFVFKNNQEDLINILKHNIKSEYTRLYSNLASGHPGDQSHKTNELEKNTNKLLKIIGKKELHKFLDILMEEQNNE